MRRNMSSLAIRCLTAGILLAGTNAGETFAAETEDSLIGQMAFAQCEEYINIRSGADTGSEIVAKIYNNGQATILEQEGDWYEIQSGNAVGYAKAEYFVTGAQAEAIAKQVAYRVATVYPEALTIRSQADETSEPIGTACRSEELEVVDYAGDWMKVALGNDVYGYVNAYYVGYDTYYPTAITLEEERAQTSQYQEEYGTDSASVNIQAEAAAQAQAAAEAAAQAQAQAQAQAEAAAQAQAEAEAAAQAQAEAEAAVQAQAEAEAAAQAQAEAEAAVQTQAEAEAAAQAQAQAEAQAEAAAQAQAEAEAAAAQAQAEAEAAAQSQAEAEAAAQAQAEAEAAAAQAQAEAEAAAQSQAEAENYGMESSGYSLGQQIVDYATQFIGGPYVYGGTSLTGGADCSGFTQSVFSNFGISLPRVAADQAYGGTSVDLGSIQAGDLLFYSDGGGISHVAIYMGNGSIVHASNPSTGITTASYNYSTPVCAARYW